MYYSHFGLNQAPFKITPNTDFFFSGGNRGPILEALIYTVTNGEGIVKVTGEVGSGKTMLCNMLQTRLPPHVETVYLAHPNVLPEEILHAIAFELQLGVDRGAPRIEVMHRLHDHLLARHADGRRVVMFVEESQSMPLATLEEIRLLSNLETRNDKLLQIVLFGQPELDENLRRPSIRQLRERVTHSFRLEPLNAAETREYLMFRLRAAGYRGPDLFSPAVIKYIARASRGLTRRINLIADKALLAAFSENTHTVRLSHVKAAVHDSEFSARHRGPHFAWGMMLMVTGAAVGALAYALILRGSGNAIEADGGVATSVAAAKSASTVTTGSGTGPSAGGGPLPTARNAQSDGALAAKEPTPRQGAATRTPMAVAPAASSRRPSETEPDLVDRRLAATQQWLSDAAQTTYSIQLMGVEDEDQLKHHLNDLAKFIEVNKVFLYRTVANRKASLTVLYGSFSDRRAAQDALDQLPSSLKTYRPILRTVRGVRTEIMRHRSS